MPFLVGKRLAIDLSSGIFAHAFLFIAGDHAFTGGIVAGFSKVFSFPLYLLILDAHLDLFASQDVSFPVHRGNFLAHLLRREGFPEDRLLVCSDIHAWPDIRKKLEQVPPGFLYLSWDVDFGFPEVACFPSGISSEHLEGLFADTAWLLSRKGLRLIGVDLVEFNHERMVDSRALALRISRFLFPLFEREEV